MRFTRRTVKGEGFIEDIIGAVFCFVLFASPVIFLGVQVWNQAGDELAIEKEAQNEQVAFEHTAKGTVTGKRDGSSGYNKAYYVTVKNGKYKAEHQVSLSEYNAAKAGDEYPIDLEGYSKSDSISSEDKTEKADNSAAAAAGEAYDDGYNRGRRRARSPSISRRLIFGSKQAESHPPIPLIHKPRRSQSAS